MTTKSNPPSEDAERRGPVSIMPATEGIDSDWGAEPEAATVSPGDSAATAVLPETRPAAKVEVPPPAKVPVILLPEAESVRAATRSVGPPTKPSPPARARSGAAVYIAAGLLAAAGIWWTARSSEPERPSAPVAVAPPPMVSATPATVDPASTPSAAPAAGESPAPSASAAPSGSDVPSAAGNASAASPAAPAAAASGEIGETIAVKINITPEGSKLTLKGEEVGKTPMTIELPRGERRVYEVVSKGYYPRRLVIDGTKTEISYGLKPVEAQPAQ